MQFSDKKNATSFLLALGSLLIVSLILWNTNIFFKKFKEEERKKMEIWATAQAEFDAIGTDQELGELNLKVFQLNTTTPMILVNKDDGSLSAHNMDSLKIQDSLYLQKKLLEFKSENPPLQLTYEGEVMHTLYYGNSDVLNKLKYYPIALLLIIFLFGAVIFSFFRTNKISEQNKLWAGMAKETAHQIGTPLSSLLGWNEILKTENISEDITQEIAKDINRLQIITERFSKIGSIPHLDDKDIVAETQAAFDYLKTRTSKLITFTQDFPVHPIMVKLNSQLYHWTIENLVKNGIDAMKGQGSINITIVSQTGDTVKIQVSDTGKGIPKSDQNNIFNPGFTTKKRGWGLGLSLVKRIVEDYHKGKIKVLQSSKDKGTTMQISLKISNINSKTT